MIREVTQRNANYWLPRLLSISDQVHAAADRSAQKHFAHMLQNSDPEFWNLLVNNLFWFKQCVCLWKQLVFNCYTDFNVEKVNNLWLMLAVVHCAASCMLKKPFILWYVFIHSTRKEKARRLVSDRIFLWTLHFLPSLKCLLTNGAGRKARVGSQEHLCTLAFI